MPLVDFRPFLYSKRGDALRIFYMHSGYIKLWRKLEHSPIFTNSEAVHLFIYLLIKASRTARKTTHKTTVINLLPGQLVTGRKKLSEATGINESKVYRILELLKSEQQIEQQTNKHYSIITITNWTSYQENEQQNEQQMNNKRTTDEQQMNTIQELKNEEKEKKESRARFTPPTIEEVSCYCRERNNGVIPEKWHNHYSSKGWMVGKNKMKDWKAAVRTWEKDNFDEQKVKTEKTAEQIAFEEKVRKEYAHVIGMH